MKKLTFPVMKSFFAALLLMPLGMLYGQTAKPVEQQPKGEPADAKAAAEKKNAIDKANDEKYQAWKATCSPEEQAWLKVLEENLGGFYLPLYKMEKARGSITAWDYVKDDPKLPRVLLIGDSISRGYTLATRKALAGKVNVHRAPENCGPTTNGLKKLDIWLGDGKWDVIHFNFGIHDRNTADAVYAANLEKLIARLEKTGAKLIWARTTPPASATNSEKYSPETCIRLNRVADEVMKRHNLPENDLCSLVQPRLAELQSPNNVHFIEAGYTLMGDQVAATILTVLGKPAALPAAGTDKPAAPPTVQPAAVEKDKRVQSDGKGWRLDQAKIIDPKRPRVLVIGDSILNGYLPAVTKALEGKVYVDAWVNPYCQSENFNKMLGQVLEHGPYDVVHINTGLHGWQKGRIPEGKFESLTKAFVETIRQKCPKARIIWASSTPVTVKGKPTELDPEINATIVEHNRMAAKVMAEMQVPVNDFYALLVDKLNLARGDQFHWNAPAYKLLADCAANSIIQTLPAARPEPSGNPPKPQP